MRATKFERLTSASVGDPDPSGARPGSPAVAAFGFALDLWDALRDAIAAATARAPHARRGPVGERYESRAPVGE